MPCQWHTYYCVFHGALRTPRILVPHYARSSLRGRARDSVCRGGSPAIVSCWTMRPVSTSNSSWTQRSGPVGVGSSKGVAISDDGSSKGLFTLFLDGLLGVGEPPNAPAPHRGARRRWRGGDRAAFLAVLVLQCSPLRDRPARGPLLRSVHGRSSLPVARMKTLSLRSRAAAVESLHLRCRTRYLTYVILP